MKTKIFVLLFTAVYITAAAQKKPASISEASVYNELLLYANTLNVIDAHEHLLCAEDHTKSYLSFWNFFSEYVKWDLMSAGLPKSYEGYMPQNEQEVIELFNAIEPYLPYVENGSYMLSVKMALKEYFGYDKITRANYLDITRRVNKENTIENYHKILQDAHIVKILW